MMTDRCPTLRTHFKGFLCYRCYRAGREGDLQSQRSLPSQTQLKASSSSSSSLPCWPLSPSLSSSLRNESCVIKRKTESPRSVCHWNILVAIAPVWERVFMRLCALAMRQRSGCQPSCHSSPRCALDPCLRSKVTHTQRDIHRLSLKKKQKTLQLLLAWQYTGQKNCSSDMEL